MLWNRVLKKNGGESHTELHKTRRVRWSTVHDRDTERVKGKWGWVFHSPSRLVCGASPSWICARAPAKMRFGAFKNMAAGSGAGTNLKVGEAQNNFVVPLKFFWL